MASQNFYSPVFFKKVLSRTQIYALIYQMILSIFLLSVLVLLVHLDDCYALLIRLCYLPEHYTRFYRILIGV